MASSRRLTLAQINDTHGYLEAHPELVWHGREARYPTMGGYARIQTVLNGLRASNPDGVVLLDNGDTFHGTYPAVASKGLDLVPLTNALGIDAMTAHWEFAWGPAHFIALAGRLGYPVLAANCHEVATGAKPFAETLVVERAGLRVGIVGLAATILDKSMPPHFSEGLRFTDGFEEAAECIARLRSRDAVDLVVLLSHLGFPQDMELAAAVRGIDVVLSGHTHNRLERPARAGNALVIQSGCHGSFLGVLDLDVGDGRILDARHRLVPIDGNLPADPGMARMVDDVMAPHRTMLGEVVGRTDVGLHRCTTLESPMDDLLLAAIARAAGTGIAFSNGWRYGAPIPPGPVTMNDVWNVVPTNPPISTVSMTGAEIVEMLEENVERTYSGQPFHQMGGYLKRFHGITVYGKLENPSGCRIESIFLGSERLRPEDRHDVGFITAQGVPPRFGTERRDLPIRAVDALADFLRLGGTAERRSVGRFVAV